MSAPTPNGPFEQALVDGGWQYGGEDENGLEHWSITIPIADPEEALEA